MPDIKKIYFYYLRHVNSYYKTILQLWIKNKFKTVE